MDDDNEREEAKRELEGYLNERMRILISDGRVVDGMFQCTDNHRNIVLANCEEFLNQDELGKELHDNFAARPPSIPPYTSVSKPSL